MAAVLERNQDATVYCGNVDDKVQEAILWELFLQAGPVVNVHMPKDRITQNHQGYGFIEFMSEEDADYAIKIMNMIKVYGKPIRVNKAAAHNKNLDVGANIFIGNLDPDIDEKLLYDTFSAFGVILTTPKIMRDPETGNSKGFAFINFASFEASDAAIDAMNGQYLSNRPISVSYSFKKDSKGERHGSAAERLLAANNPLTQTDRPHQLFADAPPSVSTTDAHSGGHPGMPPVLPPPIVPPMGHGLQDARMPPPPFPPPGFGLPPGPPPPGMPLMPPHVFNPNMMPPNMPPPPPSSQGNTDISTSSSGDVQRLPPPIPPPMLGPPPQMNQRGGPLRGPPPGMMMPHPFGDRPPWGLPQRGMMPLHGMRGPPMPPRMGFDPRNMPPRPLPMHGPPQPRQ